MSATKPTPPKTPIGGPSPADYDITKTKLNKGPAYSFGTRLKELKSTQTPGFYDSSSQQNSSKKISLKSRHSPFVLVFPTTRFDTLRLRS